MGPQFFETPMGRKFCEGQFPKMVQTLERIACALENPSSPIRAVSCEEDAALKDYPMNMIDAVINMIGHAEDLEPDIWVDGYMILTDSKEAFEKMDAFFQLFDLDYTTGEIDQPGDHYYLDFEFSDGRINH